MTKSNNHPKSDLARWKADALALAEADVTPLATPVHVVFGEAVDVAKFFERYWEEAKDGDNVVRPGLRSAEKPVRVKGGAPRLSASLGADILSLQRAAQEAQTAYLLAVDAKVSEDPLARGRLLVSEMSATLGWLLDDGVEDASDAQLASVIAAHADDPLTTDALASELDDFAALAKQHRANLEGLGGFDVAMIREAAELAATLRARPTQPAPLAPAARAALALRNRVFTLLTDRMGLVRAAARFVFRDRPEIVREATSAYERRRRVAAKRAGTGVPAPGTTAAGNDPSVRTTPGAPAAT